MMDSDSYSIKNNSYQSNLVSQFDEARKSCKFFDVGIACKDSDGRILNGHKIILSSSSEVFKRILSQQVMTSLANAIIYLHSATYDALALLLDFIYSGTVIIPGKNFDSFFRLGNELEVYGLTVDNPNQSERIETSHGDTDEHVLCTDQNQSNNVEVPKFWHEKALKFEESHKSMDTNCNTFQFPKLNTPVDGNATTSKLRDLHSNCNSNNSLSMSFESVEPSDSFQLFEHSHREPILGGNAERKSSIINEVDRTRMSMSPKIIDFNNDTGNFITNNITANPTFSKRKSHRIEKKICLKENNKQAKAIKRERNIMPENSNTWHGISCTGDGKDEKIELDTSYSKSCFYELSNSKPKRSKKERLAKNKKLQLDYSKICKLGM